MVLNQSNNEMWQNLRRIYFFLVEIESALQYCYTVFNAWIVYLAFPVDKIYKV